MFGKFFVVFLFVIITHQTSYIPLATIDAFQGYGPTLFIIIGPSFKFPVSLTEYNQNSTILGFERDVELTVESGLLDSIYSIGVGPVEFWMETPSGGSSYSLLQYDGVDGSMSLHANGLKNFDATFGGNATAFFIVASNEGRLQLRGRGQLPGQFLSRGQTWPRGPCVQARNPVFEF